MAIGRYNPVAGDVILSGFPTNIDSGWGVKGCIILTNRADAGNGWRYVVRYGYQFINPGYMDMSVAYVTLNYLNVGGATASYTRADNVPGFVTMAPGYYMLSGTTSITIPYGASISGNCSVTANRVNNPGNWSYGSPFNAGSSFPPSPIPPVPGLNFPQPTNVTSTSIYLNCYFDGDARQRSYYYMAMTRVGVGYLANPAHSGTSGNREYYNRSVTGLTPETAYTFRVDLKDKNGVTRRTVTRTVTTLSQAKLHYKTNNAWRHTFPYMKVNNVWRRSKHTYMKVNGTWRRSRDQ